MKIEKLIEEVIKKEKGYVNHPADKGGPTKYGITLATLSNYLHKTCTAADVKALTKETAGDIYRAEYFSSVSIDKLPDAIQPMLFDMAVNHGGHNAIRMLQEELTEFDDRIHIGKVDGIIGKLTISATQSVIANHSTLFINRLVNRRLHFYRDIVKNRPSQAVFLNGWETRAKSFLV